MSSRVRGSAATLVCLVLAFARDVHEGRGPEAGTADEADPHACEDRHRRALQPHLPVSTSLKQRLAGRDPALEAAVALIMRKQAQAVTAPRPGTESKVASRLMLGL